MRSRHPEPVRAGRMLHRDGHPPPSHTTPSHTPLTDRTGSSKIHTRRVSYASTSRYATMSNSHGATSPTELSDITDVYTRSCTGLPSRPAPPITTDSGATLPSRSPVRRHRQYRVPRWPSQRSTTHQRKTTIAQRRKLGRAFHRLAGTPPRRGLSLPVPAAASRRAHEEHLDDEDTELQEAPPPRPRGRTMAMGLGKQSLPNHSLGPIGATTSITDSNQ